MNNERKTQLLELLNIAKEMVNNGQELSTEYARVFFPPERREYELTYYGKESKEQIIGQHMPLLYKKTEDMAQYVMKNGQIN